MSVGHRANPSLAEVEMVDQILSQEHQEFEALVSSMQDNEDQEHHQTTSDYGSDEEEYDQLALRETSTVDDPSEEDQEMDTSIG